MARARFLVHGRVQGVGFRWFVARVAGRLGLSGTACNLGDGSVEVTAQGSEKSLEALEGELRRGPSLAHVARVEKLDVPHEIELPNSFEIM